MGPVCLLGITIHVECKRNVTRFGEPMRLVTRVLIETRPLVHHQNRWPFASSTIVVLERALEHCVAGLIVDLALYHRGLSRDR